MQFHCNVTLKASFGTVQSDNYYDTEKSPRTVRGFGPDKPLYFTKAAKAGRSSLHCNTRSIQHLDS